MALPASNALDFFHIVGDLKHVKRTGWVVRDIDQPESVADHMYRMAMLVFMLQDLTINKDRLLKICLVHDLAEAIVGDITPVDKNFTGKQKQKLEIVSIVDIRVNTVTYCTFCRKLYRTVLNSLKSEGTC